MRYTLDIMLICGALIASYSYASPIRDMDKQVPAEGSTHINKPSSKNTTMKGFAIDIEKSTKENQDFRRVLYTAKHMQLVLMSLKPGEEIGSETHAEVDQFFRFESGVGNCIIDGTVHKVTKGDVIIVPAGAVHNVINTSSDRDLRLYTIYAGPNHKDGVVRATKQDAEEKEEKYDGVTTE